MLSNVIRPDPAHREFRPTSTNNVVRIISRRSGKLPAGDMYGLQSWVFDQAENRLHARKALLYLLPG